MMTRKKAGVTKKKADVSKDAGALFAAEAAYAESIFGTAIGDVAASIAALEEALAVKPDYAPAILSMGSVEYQRRRRAEGKRLFLSLLSLPEDEELREIIDHAGQFLIETREYADGLELFREAARRFPDSAEFHQGIGCCAGHEGLMAEALAASRRAVELEPGKVEYVSDLGWTLLEAEHHEEAEATLRRAVAMDPANDRARENLKYCLEMMPKQARK